MHTYIKSAPRVLTLCGIWVGIRNTGHIYFHQILTGKEKKMKVV